MRVLATNQVTLGGFFFDPEVGHAKKNHYFLRIFQVWKSDEQKMYGVAIFFVPLNYLFLSFCSLSLGDLGEILAINLQKWSPLESLYRCFFVYDFDCRFFGWSAGAGFFKMQNSLLRICFLNQQKL